MWKYRIIKETNSHNEEYFIIQQQGFLFGWNSCGYNGDTWKTYQRPKHYDTLEQAQERLKVFTTKYKQEVVYVENR